MGLTFADSLWFDELDKMKDRRTRRFKGVGRRKGASAVVGMKKWRRYFNRAYGMTGTPNSRHLMDLWAEAYCIDKGLTFGDSFTTFQRMFFYQKDFMGYDWQPFEWAEEKLFDMLAPFTVRVEAAGDCLT